MVYIYLKISVVEYFVVFAYFHDFKVSSPSCTEGCCKEIYDTMKLALSTAFNVVYYYLVGSYTQPFYIILQFEVYYHFGIYTFI